MKMGSAGGSWYLLGILNTGSYSNIIILTEILMGCDDIVRVDLK